MDFYDDRVREDINENYKDKKFYTSKKQYSSLRVKVLRLLMIPLLLIVLLIFAINIFMDINNFDTIIKYSKMYEVDPVMVASIIHVESKFRPEAVSNKGAYGLMQVTEQTFEFISEQTELSSSDFKDINTVDVNIMAGAWYYGYLLKMFNGNEQNALCAYNAGPNTVKSWLKNTDYCFDGENLYIIPYNETKQYIHKINIVYPIYKMMMDLKF